MRTNFSRLMRLLRKNFPGADLTVVRKAYRVAVEAHESQTRDSGEPYVIHTLKVAQILAELGLDPVVCAAGLLHDVLEDTQVKHEQLTHEFGEEITTLVDGVTKIGAIHLKDPSVTREVKQAQNIRKMLVATAKDVRVILIKLADRLHNMRTIEHLPPEKQRRIARETMEIFAPIAHRLGISSWKWELEDHAFHVLMPEDYKQISKQVAMKRRDREAHVNQTCSFLEGRLAEAEISARVIGRPKHLYSIFHKMNAQGKDFNEVMDVMGLRILTNSLGDCYNALGVVHSVWKPIPGRLKDYIAMPKHNMYQAIHTTVMGPLGRPMEIQIRSEDMDRTAREGIAAHWIYKEAGQKNKDKKLDSQLKWLQQMYEWLKDAHGPDELLDNMRRDFRGQDIYVFSPKGEVKELPAGATPLDFAYLIHSSIGHHCMGAKVNGRMVPLRYHLQTGDQVEILTSKGQNPTLDWIDIVVTGRARTRIRQRLRELGDLDPLDDPHSRSRETKTTEIRPLPRPVAQPAVPEVDEATRRALLRVDGQKGIAAKFAKCCDPMPGHAIVGYVTKLHVISVHRVDCKVFAKGGHDPARTVKVSWDGQESYRIAVRVLIGPRPNALADITSALRPMNVEILEASYGPTDGTQNLFDFLFEVSDRMTLERVLRTLRTVNGVSDVTTMDGRERPGKKFAHSA